MLTDINGNYIVELTEGEVRKIKYFRDDIVSSIFTDTTDYFLVVTKFH